MTEELESPIMRLRVLRRMSQQQLADEVGVTRQTISAWENGHQTPTLTVSQMRKLCVALGVSFDQLPDNFGPQPIHTTERDHW